MKSKYETYAMAKYTLPEENWGWNLYGAGLENFGRKSQPEVFSVPEPGQDQMLVRIDAVGMCFSDIKILRQGGKHPKLYNRDLSKEPGRLGHEVSITVIKVGKTLQKDYRPGQRFAIQPDIYQNKLSTAFGYTIPGGLIQYLLIGPEVLETDEGVCLLPLEGGISYAAASLLEPWGCVLAAYTQRRRLTPKKGGKMWIIGRPDDDQTYQFSGGLEAPDVIVLTDVPQSVLDLAKGAGKEIIEKNGLDDAGFTAMSDEYTEGKGFDDIVVLAPKSATRVSAISRLIARRGTMNIVGNLPLDGLVEVDMSRLHYDYIAFMGNAGRDIAESYGEARNRCEIRPGGTAVFIGAGGPMGQMHVQRALESPDGPQIIIATEINPDRLEALVSRFLPLAEKNGRELHVINPNELTQSLKEFVMGCTDGKGADDVVVSVPSTGLMAEAATLMSADGMYVAFAGVASGSMAPLALSDVYLHHAQYTGTSGLTIRDQAAVLDQANLGKLSPGRMVAAIGGIEAARDAIEGVIESRYPGKIVIFPQIHDLPLTGLDQLAAILPEVADKLGPGNVWTIEAEAALFEKCWKNE